MKCFSLKKKRNLRLIDWLVKSSRRSGDSIYKPSKELITLTALIAELRTSDVTATGDEMFTERQTHLENGKFSLLCTVSF